MLTAKLPRPDVGDGGLGDRDAIVPDALTAVLVDLRARQQQVVKGAEERGRLEGEALEGEADDLGRVWGDVQAVHARQVVSVVKGEVVAGDDSSVEATQQGAATRRRHGGVQN